MDDLIAPIFPEPPEAFLLPMTLMSAQDSIASPAANIVVSSDKPMPRDSTTRHGAGQAVLASRLANAGAVVSTRRGGRVVDGTPHAIATAKAVEGGRLPLETRPSSAAPLGSAS